MLKPEQKAALLGAEGKVLAGGTIDPDAKYDKPHFENNKVPVNWHAFSRQFFEDRVADASRP